MLHHTLLVRVLLVGLTLAGLALLWASPAEAGGLLPPAGQARGSGQSDEGFVNSLIWSGALAMALAGTGLAIVGWHRRRW